MNSFRVVLSAGAVGAGLLTVIFALAALGCGDDYQPANSSSSSSSSVSGGGSGTTTTTTGQSGGGGSAFCDPGALPSEDDCVISDEQGIFVRAGGDDSNAGTMNEPVATLQAAADKAAAEGKRVYACGEAFTENLTVPEGVELFGAFVCDSGWTYHAAEPTSLTEPADSTDPPLQFAPGGGAKLYDFVITAADKTEGGASSIAVIADNVVATFVRCKITAGTTAKGVDGQDGSNTPAATGASGKKGQDADCQSYNVTAKGGASVTSASCTSSVSGKGGDGGLATGPGQGGDSGLPSGNGGAGGIGQDLLVCSPGGEGAKGTPGEPGQGASGKGTIGKSGFSGVSGGDGKPGGPGQGGGGGGGSKAPPQCGPDKIVVGAAGGSGSAGGCGGAPGKGAGWAGSSIALLSIHANVTLIDSVLTAGAAGDGGQGGDGQTGGSGGVKGYGGVGLNGSLHGCAGGIGGKGGDGGPGGGGTGGHSLAIAHTDWAPVVQGEMSLIAGAAGNGGLGGDGNNANKGGDGTAAEILAFD